MGEFWLVCRFAVLVECGRRYSDSWNLCQDEPEKKIDCPKIDQTQRKTRQKTRHVPREKL